MSYIIPQTLKTHPKHARHYNMVATYHKTGVVTDRVCFQPQPLSDICRETGLKIVLYLPFKR